MSRFKNMTIKQLDKEIDKVPRTYQKACMLMAIKRERPDYKSKYERIEKNKR